MNRTAASSHRPPSLPPLTRLLSVLSLLSCSSVNGVELISTTDPSKCLWLSAPSGSYTLSHDCTYSGAYEAAAQDAILDATKKAALTSAFSHYLPIMTVSAPFTVIGIPSTSGKRPIISGDLRPLFEVKQGAEVLLKNLHFIKFSLFVGGMPNIYIPGGFIQFNGVSGTNFIKFTMEDSVVDTCSSRGNGGVFGVGGVYGTNGQLGIYPAKVQLVIRRCDFLNNAATNSGGVLSVKAAITGSSLVVEDSFFGDNFSGKGGGLFNNQDVMRSQTDLVQYDSSYTFDIILRRSFFSGNRAAHMGGIMYYNDNGLVESNANIMTNQESQTIDNLYIRNWPNTLQPPTVKISDNRLGGRARCYEETDGTACYQGGVTLENYQKTPDGTADLSSTRDNSPALYTDCSTNTVYSNWQMGFSCVVPTFDTNAMLKMQVTSVFVQRIGSGVQTPITSGVALIIALLTPRTAGVDQVVQVILDAAVNDILLPRAVGFGCLVGSKELLCTGSVHATAKKTILSGDPTTVSVIKNQRGGRMFEIFKGHRLEISYLTLTAGVGSDDQGGGAILVHSLGTAIIFDSTFLRCTSNDRFYGGGALQATGGSAVLRVSSSTFKSNVATFFDGGAIGLAEGADAVITECTFENNSALMQGGGALSAGGVTTKVNVTKSTFAENVANTNGGAVRLVNIQSGSLSGISMRHNKAGINGGAVYVVGDALDSIVDSVFHSNEANTGNGGGVAFVRGSFTRLINLQLSLNKANEGKGGGLSMEESSIRIQKDVNISHNIASHGGGLAVLLFSSPNIEPGELLVAKNKATIEGGGWFVSESVFFLDQPLGPIVVDNVAPKRSMFGYDETSDKQPSLECLKGTYDPNRLEDEPSTRWTSTRLCPLCPAGWFTNARSSAACLQVADGWESTTCGDNLGFTSCTSTKVCAKGTFSSLLTKYQCTDCPTRSVARTSSSDCTACQVGHFVSDDKSECIKCSAGRAGVDICTLCTIGFYQNDTAQTECQSCPKGWTNDLKGQTYCTQCEAGTFMNAKKQCEKCSLGQFSNQGGQLNCTTCETGQTSLELGQTFCTQCEAGQYMTNDLECKDCTVGKYTNRGGQSNCTNCSAAETSTVRATFCSQCEAGTFMNTTKQCQECDVGEYSNQGGQFTCKTCVQGQTSKGKGQTYCSQCEAGKYMTVELECLHCGPGQYSNKGGQFNCTNCSAEETSIAGSTFCSKCDAGKFMNLAKVCEFCLPGKVSTYGKKECTGCEAGYYTNVDLSSCEPCAAGKYSEQSRQTTEGACVPCQVGTYSSARGASSIDFCNACQPGRYSTTTQNTIGCQECPKGYMQGSPGSVSCKSLGSNAIGLGGGAAEVIVPPGSYLTGCSSKKDDTSCTGFQQCPSGWVGSAKELVQECSSCPEGTSSFTGTTDCRMCSKGKYSNAMASAVCIDCIPHFYQPQDINPSTKCIACPTGYTQDLKGESSCFDPGGIKPADCGDDEYWVPNKEKSNKAGCLLCPPGGSCSGPITKAGINTLFGWSKCPNLNVTYAPCAFGAACNGAKNDLLVNKYVDELGNDPATMNRNASCATSYKNNSLLCAACADDYSRAGGGSKCEECPPPSGNVLLASLGSLAGIVGLFVLTAMNVSDKGNIDLSDGAKSIGLSFVQVITLLTSFPIAWPQIFVNIFQVGGAVTTMGQHLVNFKCFYPERSEADVFYTTVIVWAIVPFLLPLISVMVWLLLSKTKDVKDLRSKMKSTVVGLLYLIWPTLISTTFSLFSCSTVCDQTLLRIDLEEECWVERHATYAFALGVPMLIVYVFGFPLLAMVMVQRLQKEIRETRKSIADTSTGTVGSTAGTVGSDKNKGPKHHRWFSNINVVQHVSAAQMSTHEAFGILYTSFRENCWWWECTVTVRKIMIVGIGVFGEGMGEMQVHVTLLCVATILLFTAMVQPYGKRQLLHYLELSALMSIWLTLWAGNVFNANPRCEDGIGGTIGWCDAISITIGMIDIFMVLLVVGVMVYYKRKGREGNASKEPFKVLVENPVNLEMANLAAVAVEMKTDVASSGQHARNVTHLPDNWQRHVDEETGTKYYEQPDGSTQWSRPECEENSHLWEELVTEDGVTYYVDSEGQTHWQRPTTKFYDNAMQKK